MTFEVSVEGDVEEPRIDRNEFAPGVGCLVAKRGPNAGSRFALDKDLVTAGRHPDSDIFLDDITVSRRHVEVERRDGGYVVRDAGSLNGTYVNRQRVEEAQLHDGDEVQIGTFKLLFLDGCE
jgi:pSer/pThr/pTyr-binding forkhead associated (FHA) protein